MVFNAIGFKDNVTYLKWKMNKIRFAQSIVRDSIRYFFSVFRTFAFYFKVSF